MITGEATFSNAEVNALLESDGFPRNTTAFFEEKRRRFIPCDDTGLSGEPAMYAENPSWDGQIRKYEDVESLVNGCAEEIRHSQGIDPAAAVAKARQELIGTGLGAGADRFDVV